MSWNQILHRVPTGAGAELTVFGSRALAAGTYPASASWPGGCGGVIQANIVALRGGASLIQQNSNTSGTISATTWTLAFPSNNTARNCLILDISFSAGSFTAGPVSVTDSRGNTWAQAASGSPAFQGDFLQTWVCSPCASGANTVTITIAGSFPFTNISASVLEYRGASATVDGEEYGTGTTFGVGSPINISATASAGDLLHLVTSNSSRCGDVTVTGGGADSCSAAWLMINEPGTLSPLTQNVWTDQSERIFLGEKLSFSWIVRQRGQAKIPLIVHADDSYHPTVGSQVCLWDLTDNAEYEVFSGTIDDIDWRWLDNTGYRIFTLTVVSLDQVFDTIRLPDLLFLDMTAGDIFTALFAYAAGSPVALGVVSSGTLIANFLIQDYPSISDAFTRLATLAGFIWGVDPGDGTLYFHLPSASPSPFTLTSEDVLWLSFTLKQERQDYRNKQILKVPDSIAVQSSEYFVGSGQLNFTLLRPVASITAAWITENTQNNATATFSARPALGDVVSFAFPTSGSGFNWQANHTYDVGAIVIDPSGFVQRATIAGGGTQSGATEPSWIDIVTQVTTDNTMSWTNEGPAGFANGDIADYTFVDVLDNTQFGQVLRGSSAVDSINNLADAINAIAAQAGITFSLPTWENPQVNATAATGSGHLIVKNKAAGSGFVTALGATGTAISWDSATTNGGSTTFGTISVNVGIQGQTTGGSGPTLVYTPGSPDISLATPLNALSNLQVQYVASNANYIQVEDTPAVVERARIEQGTGKYQQVSSDDQAITLPQALQLAQQQLAAYGVIPSTFEFDTFQAGLYVGQVVTVDMDFPSGIDAIVNAEWFIQEIKGEVIPVQDLSDDPMDYMGPQFLPGPNGGHYKYTVTCIDVAQIGSWIDFWLGLTGGGSGGGSLVSPGGGSLGPPSGGGSGYTQGFTAVAGTPLAITHGLNTAAVIIAVQDSSSPPNGMTYQAVQYTSVNVVTLTFGISFSGTVIIMGVA